MNAQQIALNESVIKHNQAEIARVEKELENPRIRKVEQRLKIIADLKIQIQQAREFLESA